MMQLRKLGYAAHIVVDGRAAVTAVAEREYAVVLMDCQMPELDGFAAARAIRAAEARIADGNGVGRRPRVPLIAMTANAIPGDREACLAAGMDDYIAKPVKTDLLREVIERWLPVAVA